MISSWTDRTRAAVMPSSPPGKLSYNRRSTVARILGFPFSKKAPDEFEKLMMLPPNTHPHPHPTRPCRNNPGRGGYR